MSKNLITLMTTAAELRSGGASWEAVGKHVKRSAKTCGRWPSRYKQQWEPLYLQEQRNRYSESGDKALMMMRRLLRSENEKSQLKAAEIILRHGPHLALAKNAPATVVELTAETDTDSQWRAYWKALMADGTDTTDIDRQWRAFKNFQRQERERIDARRAARGLPPANDDEFNEELCQDLRERMMYRPPMDYHRSDESAPSNADPHGDAAEHGNSLEHGALTQPRSPIPAGIDIGQLLFIALAFGFPPARGVSKEVTRPYQTVERIRDERQPEAQARKETSSLALRAAANPTNCSRSLTRATSKSASEDFSPARSVSKETEFPVARAAYSQWGVPVAAPDDSFTPAVYISPIDRSTTSATIRPSGDRMGRSLLGSFAVLAMTSSMFAAEPEAKKIDPGVLPLGADGKPLNLDFETGTLKDWTTEGEAFKDQPIKGDTVFPRRGDNKSEHQGQYWIGGYEKVGDKPQGTLTSVAFKVTHPWASFLVGGGPHDTTCVELVNKETGKVFFRASGMEAENLRRVAVDVKGLMGKEIFIRIVDKHSGHWGHVNFDDFRFHAEKPSAPQRPQPIVADEYKYAGLKPEDSAKAMTVPDGFEIKLFAGEPDIVQPVAFCLDDRGRVWVAEAYSYPTRRNDKDAKDRILIFEDTTGSGKFDKRTVFMEGLNLVSGLEVGFGGVWIGAAPYLMYVPMKDDKPAGEPKILLDGWGYQDTHETLNSFTWGPDGWLYGCHGVFTHSRIGKPGTPDKDRAPINAGVWRYHPTQHRFEVFAEGTSNPWGLDFDAHGNCFVTACVIPHAFHIIPGGRYQRQAGQHFNPYTYADIPTIADHLHWQGANQWAGNATSGSKGGGHAHCGLMIYQGGTWPKEYHGKMFMGNVHGHRINMDVLKPKGSGFTASHGQDFLLANDAWARFINLKYGPDGNVYLIDWYDKQACHVGGDTRAWDRSNGRIYKICHKDAKPVTGIDLQKCTDAELAQYQSHENEWYVRHARRILQERFSDPLKFKPQDFKKVNDALDTVGTKESNLRALWVLSSAGEISEDQIIRGLENYDANIRAWAIRIVAERSKFRDDGPLQHRLQRMAHNDRSPIVRLALAAAMQRFPLIKRVEMLGQLVGYADDVSDPNLALMYWFAFEPYAEFDPKLAIDVAMRSKIPLLRNFMVRRLSALGTPLALQQATGPLAVEESSVIQLDLLRNINEGLKGRRNVPMPEDWPATYVKLSKSDNSEVRAQATALAITFGDPIAFAAMRRVLSDVKADLPLRQNALTALLGAKDKDLAPTLQKLLAEPALRSAALNGLAAYDDPKTPAAILALYGKCNSEEKRNALNTLASRSVYAKELLGAVEKKIVPPSDVSADIVRSMMNLNDPSIEKQIGAAWGIVRRTPAEKIKLIAETKKMLLTKPQAAVDLWHGRAMFQKTCAQCHTLYGVGAKIGPDITGSNRPNLDYLLENVLDPSAVIPKEYAMTVFEMDNGRKVEGIVKEDTPVAVTVQTANELLVLPKKEIESRRTSDVSMMPDDILKTLKPDEFRALIAYLQHPQQVPMLATEENAKDFFNGKDLTGWYGDPKLWSVENGEIVGKSPGIKQNEFLKSHLAASDFKLTLQVKLTPDKENSGVQIRSEPLPNGEMKGHQADIGAGWWGKLYEESGRGLLWDKPGDMHVKKDDWNEYVILAKGGKIQTWINGKLCVNLDDPKGAPRGIFGLQIHSGGPMEVRFKDVKLEINPK